VRGRSFENVVRYVLGIWSSSPIPNKILVFKRDLVFIHKHKVNCGLERFLKGLNVNKDTVNHLLLVMS